MYPECGRLAHFDPMLAPYLHSRSSRAQRLRAGFASSHFVLRWRQASQACVPVSDSERDSDSERERSECTLTHVKGLATHGRARHALNVNGYFSMQATTTLSHHILNPAKRRATSKMQPTLLRRVRSHRPESWSKQASC